MKSKKGFTLIELLAVIVILGIVIAIAIPGINSVINNARKNTFVQTADLFANGVRNSLIGGVYTAEPTTTHAVGVPLEKIPMEKGGQKSPYGKEWVKTQTYVIITREADKNVFYFAGLDADRNGIALTKVDSITSASVVSSPTIGLSGTGIVAKPASGFTALPAAVTNIAWQ